MGENLVEAVNLLHQALSIVVQLLPQGHAAQDPLARAGAALKAHAEMAEANKKIKIPAAEA